MPTSHTLGTRIGRLRTEPLGLDRDGREFFLLGGPSEGQQPLADFSRLLVRRRSPAAPPPADADAASAPPLFVDEWVCVGSPDELQALLASLRVGGVREGNLHKSLTTRCSRCSTPRWRRRRPPPPRTTAASGELPR